MLEHRVRRLAEPRAEQWVFEIGARFVGRADRVKLRHRAEAEPGDLRKDEPHPVALFLAALQLGERVRIDALLRGDEPLELKALQSGSSFRRRVLQARARSVFLRNAWSSRIACPKAMRLPSGASTSSSRCRYGLSAGPCTSPFGSASSLGFSSAWSASTSRQSKY